MNFSQLQTLVLSWLDDPQAAYFTLPQINVWINNGQREVQKLLLKTGDLYYATKMSGTTQTNQGLYALPSDFVKLHKFEIVIAGAGTTNEIRETMAPVTYNQLDQVSQQQGCPAAYNIRRNIVELRPIPDNTYTMYLSQSYRVVDMALPGDLPDVPTDYVEYIAVLATLDGFLKDQRDPSAFVAAKKDKYEMQLKQDAQMREVSQPRQVVVTSDDSPGYLF